MSLLSRPLIAALAAVASLAAAGPAAATITPEGIGLPGAPDTAATKLPTNWACFPGRAPNPCEGSLETTVLSNAQLRPRKVARIENPKPATDPPIDCFYVYPTVTEALGENGPRHTERNVQAILQGQAAPLSPHCRVFAPIYRQATIVSVFGSILTKQTTTSAAQNRAFADVRGAWDDYLAHDNHGRGVVLIGHSQGAGMILRLLTAEIDHNAAERKLLVSAIVPGANLAVRQGERTGGNLENIPTCVAPGETGCAIAWSMYGAAPGRDSWFGRIGPLSMAFGGPTGPDLEVACTNPAELSGDGGVLHPIARGHGSPGTNGLLEAGVWGGFPPQASTPFVVPGDHYTAACARSNGANVLRLKVGSGSLMPNAVPQEDWGLHVAEMTLLEGNLVRIVERQGAAYTSAS